MCAMQISVLPENYDGLSEQKSWFSLLAVAKFLRFEYAGKDERKMPEHKDGQHGSKFKPIFKCMNNAFSVQPVNLKAYNIMMLTLPSQWPATVA
jgi:hypothetical protein